MNNIYEVTFHDLLCRRKKEYASKEEAEAAVAEYYKNCYPDDWAEIKCIAVDEKQ